MAPYLRISLCPGQPAGLRLSRAHTVGGHVSRCLPRPPVVMHDVLNVSCPATVVVAELPVPLEAGMPGAVAFDVDVVRRIAPAQIEYPDHHGGRPYARPPTAS